MRKRLSAAFMGLFLTAYCVCLVPFAFVCLLAYFVGFAKDRIGPFWYNQDRTLASGAWGTTQETISSEVGRIAIGAGKTDGWTPKSKLGKKAAISLAKWLNTTPAIWGHDHTSKAIFHADLLGHADDGHEQ